jgi:hypothetical protein
LFAALSRRGVSFEPFDVTCAAFGNAEPPRARLYFNQASPSAYIRGNTRAVPLDGRRVLSDVNANSNLPPSVAAAFGFDPSSASSISWPASSTSEPCADFRQVPAEKGDRIRTEPPFSGDGRSR